MVSDAGRGGGSGGRGAGAARGGSAGATAGRGPSNRSGGYASSGGNRGVAATATQGTIAAAGQYGMATQWMYTAVNNPVTFGHLYYPTQAYGYQGALPGTSANGSDGGAATASAASAPTIPAKEQIMDSVLKQVDYYFSEENLKKDVFLRSKVRVILA